MRDGLGVGRRLYEPSGTTRHVAAGTRPDPDSVRWAVDKAAKGLGLGDDERVKLRDLAGRAAAQAVEQGDFDAVSNLQSQPKAFVEAHRFRAPATSTLRQRANQCRRLDLGPSDMSGIEFVSVRSEARGASARAVAHGSVSEDGTVHLDLNELPPGPVSVAFHGRGIHADRNLVHRFELSE